MNYSSWKLKFRVFLFLLSFLEKRGLQQLESAKSLVENTSCSSLAILALWGFLGNMNRYDSEDRERTTLSCRKLKKGDFYRFDLANTTVKLQCLPFLFLFLLLLDSQWNCSWYPKLILTIHEKSKKEQTGCSQHYVIFLSAVIPSFHSIKLQIANADCFTLQ